MCLRGMYLRVRYLRSISLESCLKSSDRDVSEENELMRVISVESV